MRSKLMNRVMRAVALMAATQIAIPPGAFAAGDPIVSGAPMHPNNNIVRIKKNQPAPAASTLAANSEVKLFQDLKLMMETAGCQNVEIVPGIFVATGERPKGKIWTLLIDVNTMQAMELDGTSDFIRNRIRQEPKRSR